MRVCLRIGCDEPSTGNDKNSDKKSNWRRAPSLITQNRAHLRSMLKARVPVQKISNTKSPREQSRTAESRMKSWMNSDFEADGSPDLKRKRG